MDHTDLYDNVRIIFCFRLLFKNKIFSLSIFYD